MQVELQPSEVAVTAGQPAVVAVDLLNDDVVIEGFAVRLLGADPSWVDVQPPTMLSLFPGNRGTATILLTLPERFPAGRHRLVVQVYSASDPSVYELVELIVHVAEAERLDAHLEPSMVTVSRTARFGLVVTNTGNTESAVRPVAGDAEEAINASFEPDLALVPPGQQTIINVSARGRRPWFGVPIARQLDITVHGEGTSRQVTGTILQRPRIGRGLMSLVGLLIAATVFGLVLRSVFSDVVDASKVDNEVLAQAVGEADADNDVLAASDTGVAGAVVVSGFGTGAEGLDVELFAEDDPSEARQTAATDATGAFHIVNVVPGSYKLHVTGGGFTPVWYPDAESFDTADVVVVGEDQTVDGLTISVVGQGASVSGKIIAPDATGAKVRLFGPEPPPAKTPRVGGSPTGTVPAGLATIPAASSNAPPARRRGPQEVEVASTVALPDGSFSLADVPAPADYEIEVSLPGFLTERRPFHLDPGEARKGLEITLRRGAGSIRGAVVGASGPVGGALVTATDGTVTAQTTSLTIEPAGSFTLANLVTPASYTVTVTREGFRPEVVKVSLTDGQQLSGLVVVLSGGTATLNGTVRRAGGEGLGGVTVRVSNGAVTMESQTLSVGAIGAFSFAGLPAPATYTVSFAKDGFLTATRTTEVDPAAPAGAQALDVELTGATGVVRGTVSDGNGPLGGVAISLSDGTVARSLTSADSPPGAFLFEGVVPGTYTVTFARSGSAAQTVLVTVAANEGRVVDVTVGPRASLQGRVRIGTVTPAVGVTVTLYRATEFPANPLRTVITDNAGRYAIGNLDGPTTYVLGFKFAPDAPLELSEPIVIEGGEQLTVDHAF